MKKLLFGFVTVLGLSTAWAISSANAEEHCAYGADAFRNIAVEFGRGTDINVIRNEVRYLDMPTAEQDTMMEFVYWLSDKPRALMQDTLFTHDLRERFYTSCVSARKGW